MNIASGLIEKKLRTFKSTQIFTDSYKKKVYKINQGGMVGWSQFLGQLQFNYNLFLQYLKFG